MWARGDWGTLHTCASCWYSRCRGLLCSQSKGSPLKLKWVGCQTKAAVWLCSMVLALLQAVHTTPGSKWCVSCLDRPANLFPLVCVFLFPVSDFHETSRIYISLEFQKYSNIFGLNWLRKISWILRMMKPSPGHTEIVKTFWHWLSMEQGFCWQLL